MSVRFGRSVELILASELGPEAIQIGKRFFNSYTKRTTINGLRVRFQVEKTLGKDSNAATILVSNLSADTRAAFQTKPAHITLSAGYKGDNKIIYRGDIKDVESYREGTDWVTSITCGTGAHAIKGAHTSFSFGAGTTVKERLTRLAKDMGLSLPTNVKEGKSFIEQVSSGEVMHGPSMNIMKRVVGPGYSVSIQDDKLVVLEEDGVRFAAGTRIAQDTGMIGIPTIGPPRHEKGKPILTVKTLLNGDLQAGGFAQLRTDTVNGDYKCERVTHSGDTHGQEWYSSVEGPAL